MPRKFDAGTEERSASCKELEKSKFLSNCALHELHLRRLRAARQMPLARVQEHILSLSTVVACNRQRQNCMLLGQFHPRRSSIEGPGGFYVTRREKSDLASSGPSLAGCPIHCPERTNPQPARAAHDSLRKLPYSSRLEADPNAS